MKKFKPFLAPNQEVVVHELPYPLLASYKLDGVRSIFKDGRMISRSLKDIPNERLQEKFKKLKECTKTEPRLIPILDGELLAKSLPFNDLSGLVRTFDREPPDDLFFYMFDMVVENKFEEPFIDRLKRVEKIATLYPELIRVIPQRLVTTSEEAKAYFYEAVEDGCDGLILRHPMGRYKCGRGTIKEGLIYKLKPYISMDARIIGIKQATKVDPKAEKKINELGYSETSKKKSDRVPIDKASCFIVKYNGVPLDVTIA